MIGEGFREKEKAIKAGAIQEVALTLLENFDLEGGSGGMQQVKGGCTGLDNSNNDGGRAYGGGGGGGDSGGSGFWHKSLPPFLVKTFEMVEDPQTDELIAWSVTGNSFIIRDHLNFSSNMLPNYFKHNNFSSFLYQLNTYGFKKISSDRWEYANEWFQAGKKHLLMNMKRRTQHSPNMQRKRSVEFEIEKLRSDQNRLNTEILKLKQRQQSIEHHLDTINKCIRLSINLSKRQEIFWQFIKHMESKERETTINVEIAKKQKLVKAVDSTKETHQELATIDESEVSKLHQKNKAVVEATDSAVLNSENEDDHQSKIELQLEDLIGKLPDWAAYVKELMHQSELP